MIKQEKFQLESNLKNEIESAKVFIKCLISHISISTVIFIVTFLFWQFFLLIVDDVVSVKHNVFVRHVKMSQEKLILVLS